MSGVDDAFNSLFFGSGWWIGAVIVYSICLVIAYKVRFACNFMWIITLLFGINCLSSADSDSMAMWGFPIGFFVSLVIVVMAVENVGGKR